MIKKEIRIDLTWIVVLASLTILIIGFLIGFDNWPSKPFEIQLHDTYIILSIRQVFTLLFLNITFWIFLIRQVRWKFEKQTSNVILICITGLLIFVTSLTIKFIGAMDQGWTIYPPLSALPNKLPETYSISSKINSFVQAYELFQIIVLGFVGVMIGRGIEKRIHQRE
jgi:heme/copper-type cytochrome/quinol oxidase subunit 1